MKTYKVPNLTDKTSKDEQGKLLTALKGVSGVERAVLHPDKHEFEIKAKEKHEPKRDEIMQASKKAGFVAS